MEIWKPIEKYPGYEVSNLGRIKSYKQNKNGKILEGKDQKGYVAIDFRVNGQTIQDLVHRVVLSTFAPISGWEQLTVDHKNGNRQDNRVENLEWVTLSENSSRARRILKTGNAIKQVRIIMMNREEKIFNSVTEAAKSLGVTKGTISRWANGQRKYEGKYRLVEYL